MGYSGCLEASEMPYSARFVAASISLVLAQGVKNVNPRTPLMYPNQRFRYFTTPDANTYCGCGSAVTYFSAMSDKGTCSTPAPKCTSDSFFSLQATHNGTGQQDPRQAHGHKPQGEATGKEPGVATVSNALGDTAVQFASEHLTPLP